MGGLARYNKYGNLGTTEGRRKGGLNSLKTHQKRNTGFKVLRKVKQPMHTMEYAELLGILFGDGHLSYYQATITTNAETDVFHARYVVALCTKVFNIKPSLTFRKDSNACTVTLNSRRVCDYIEGEGLARGNKLTHGLKIPLWITSDKVFSRAFARGLFDTDGCVFLDRHEIKGIKYYNAGLGFASKSPELLQFFTDTLHSIDCHPTQTTPYRVFLRRAKEIDIYFKIIGSSNPKHLNRYHTYLGQIKGGVA